jgi:phosphate-selective porin
MIDPAKVLGVNRTFTTVGGNPVLADASVSQPSRILQDAFIGYDPAKAFRFKIGQFKFPLGLEAQYANSDLPTVERALFMSDRARGGDLADVRDIGAMAWGSIGSPVDYQFGVFNGAGDFQNQTDTTDRKELVGRVAIRPLGRKWFQIGSSGAWSSATNSATVDPRRNRVGLEVMLRPGKLTFITEVMGGVDGAIRRIGGYSHLAYRFGSWEPIARFDYFDPNTAIENSSANVAERDYIAGLNYYLREHHAKLQFNYLRKTFSGQRAPARNLVLVNLQTMW